MDDFPNLVGPSFWILPNSMIVGEFYVGHDAGFLIKFSSSAPPDILESSFFSRNTLRKLGGNEIKNWKSIQNAARR